jgi:hypothetical protein
MATRGSMPPSEEARLRHMSNLPETGPQGAWAGWVTFAATVLMLLGCVNGFQGFLALLDEGYFVVGRDDLFLMSYDAWGVLLVIWGGLLIVVGAALYARREWARWLAIVGVMLNVIVQVGFFPALPLLSLVLISLDVIVLFALTTHWIGES